ncbi:hypothetical protein FA15DRAFT_670049 [Coprinopsis marcescibilis]|uniref:Uncharacterized protein n=1 Tax=Coprinopsis marcescibilis TaxID=230819 RepID=A0A5C3L6V8_COPMA|nr:hypothetical protein FA15DRAFT_670049 [Coprinopsis marcescibilis]
MPPRLVSRTLEARDVSASESASLQGQPAKTPIIAGAVCGGVLFIAWVIGFAIYFRKRYNRKKQKRLAEQGKAEPPKEKLPPNASTERFIIPPDPAVLLGYAKPGEMVYTPPPSKSRRSSDNNSLPKSPCRSLSKPHATSPSSNTPTGVEDEMTEPLNPVPPPTPP